MGYVESARNAVVYIFFFPMAAKGSVVSESVAPCEGSDEMPRG
jgi:hypothetical protein